MPPAVGNGITMNYKYGYDKRIKLDPVEGQRFFEISISNLPPKTRNSNVINAFRKYGTILHCGIHGSFGTLKFSNSESAKNALEMNGKDLNGSIISIKPNYEMHHNNVGNHTSSGEEDSDDDGEEQEQEQEQETQDDNDEGVQANSGSEQIQGSQNELASEEEEEEGSEMDDDEDEGNEEEALRAYGCNYPKCRTKEGFSTSRKLFEHWREEHSSNFLPKPYKCALNGCNNKAWKNLNGIQYHVKRNHLGTKEESSDEEPGPINCPHPQCTQQYRQITGLRYHLSHGHSPSATMAQIRRWDRNIAALLCRKRGRPRK